MVARFLACSTRTHLTYPVTEQQYCTNSAVGSNCHEGHCFEGKNFPTDQVNQSRTLRDLRLQGKRSVGLVF